jgi:DNA-binding SARP family transcriptional activator/ABC-type transport system substrate-binding protein
LEFLILGPLEVRDGHTMVPLGGAKQRAALAILLLHRNQVVSRDRLIDGLWGDSPPATAAHTLETYISRLRKTLRRDGVPERIVMRRPGYTLQVADGELDLQRLEALIESGRRALAADDPQTAATALAEGLALFRGAPLEDLAYAPFAEAEVGRLDDLRVEALEGRIDADIAAGGGSDLINELEALVAAYPLRERFWAQLMLAKYRAGRQGDALATFHQARRELSDELGIDPGPSLRQLHQQILRQDAALQPAEAAVAVDTGSRDQESGDAHAPASPKPMQRNARPTDRRRWLAAAAITLAAGGIAAALFSSRGAPRAPALASLTSANSVALFDSQTHRFIADVPIHDAADAVSVGYGAVWAETDGGLKKIDLRTRQVTNIPTAVNYLALGAEAAWVSVGDPARVVRIDPTYGTQTTFAMPHNGFSPGETADPGGLAIADGSLWVAQGARFVRRIDPNNGHLEQTFTVPGAENVIAADGAVYVNSPGSGEVRKINPATNTIAWTAKTIHPEIRSLAAGGGFVWITTSTDPAVIKLDAQTGAIVSSVPTGEGTQSVVASDGAAWVSNPRAGTISRIDPSTDHVTRLRLAHAPFAMAVHDKQLWVSLWPSPADELRAAGVTGPVAHISLPGDQLEGSAEPAMIWSLIGQQLEYATEAKLYNYPDQSGRAGAIVTPEVAAAMPSLSADGRTVTIRVRSGYRFSPGRQRGAGTRVTAETFRSTIERAFSPGLNASGYTLLPQLVGGHAYANGHTSRLAGVTASGDTLTLHLLKRVPDIAQILATPIFSAVPQGTPHRWIFYPSSPSAGPYYLAQPISPIAWQLILKRNPNYHGPRPHHFDAIIDDKNLHTTTAAQQALHDQIDVVFDPLGNVLSPTSTLAHRYSTATPGHPRYLQIPWREVQFLRLNTDQGPLRDPSIRRAINQALDRPALAAVTGGIATDHYLPPGMPGVQADRHAYPITGPDLAAARTLMHGRTKHLVLWTCPTPECKQRAAIIRGDLAEIGISLSTRPSGSGNGYDLRDDSWYVDEYDPHNTLGVAMFGQPGYVDPTPFTNPAWHRRIAKAAKLDAAHGRFTSFGALELQLMHTAAPWAAYAQPTEDVLLSPRLGCTVQSPVYGLDLAALCLRGP